jgi:hypothetical protein
MPKYISLLLLLLHHKTLCVSFMGIIKYVALVKIGIVNIYTI